MQVWWVWTWIHALWPDARLQEYSRWHLQVQLPPLWIQNQQEQGSGKSYHNTQVRCFSLFITLTNPIFVQRCKAMDMSHLPAHKQYDKQPEQPHQEGAQGHTLPSGNDDQEKPIRQRYDRGWSRTESNCSSGNILLSLSDSLLICASKKELVILHGLEMGA